MKKYTIGFSTEVNNEPEREVSAGCREPSKPKKSVVHVYFPDRGMGWSYYNDSFDLKVGDFVYVEGKLEGYRGQVTEVHYSFKIKLSDYKKVVAVVDTNVKGDFYLVGSHVVSFDRNTIPFSKTLSWFKAPENDEEYVSGDDDTKSFPLDDLPKMNILNDVTDRGHEYYIENRVVYVEIDGTCGHAIVEGSSKKNYEIEFHFSEGEISNLKCSCFCSGACKHEFAAMLQLRESLDRIFESYEEQFNGYFAIISKSVFVQTVLNKKGTGKICLSV